MNRFELPGEGSLHIRLTWENYHIECDRGALKTRIAPMCGFKSLLYAKATQTGIEAFRIIQRGHVHGKQPGVKGEIPFVESLF